jgi:hypothetical protein
VNTGFALANCELCQEVANERPDDFSDRLSLVRRFAR